MLFSSHLRNSISIIGLLFVITVAGISWQDVPSGKHYKQSLARDTVPQHKKESNHDLEYQIQQLDKAMFQLEEQLQAKNWQKIQKDMQEAINKIDMEKINLQFEEAIKKIDAEKIKLDAEAAFKKVDFEKIQEDIKTAMRESKDMVNWKKMDRELKQAVDEVKKEMQKIKKIDMENLKKEMAKTREELKHEKSQIEKEMKKLKEELGNNKLEIEKDLQQAKGDIAKAKEELTAYKSMITEMEKDGLLNSKNSYKIEFKDSSLYINDLKQSAEVRNKYTPYIKKEKVTIIKEKGNIKIED
jgi:chromosome segregation ATPase